MLRARLATPVDASSLAGIYNSAIEDRSATFETDLRTDDDIVKWFDGLHPIVVVVDDETSEIVCFARTSMYSARDCYQGIFEFGVYTDHNHRRRGAASLAMRELITRARAAGAWKLVSRVFVENDGSRALLSDLGFREVGTYYRHAKLDDQWRDVVIVEKFLAPIVIEKSVAAVASYGRAASRDAILSSLRSETLQTRVIALEHARTMIEAHQFPDSELLFASADALFLVKVHDTTARSRFVDLFRAYASLSREATRDVFAALFDRLGELSLALDLDTFYEAAFVIKQIAGATASAAPASSPPSSEPRTPSSQPELEPQLPRLLEWLKVAIDLPSGMRTRISPGNVTSLLMNLALSACADEKQRQDVADLAGEAKARHRVEPPTSIRSSVPPPPMIDLPIIPPLPMPRATFDDEVDDDVWTKTEPPTDNKTTAPPPLFDPMLDATTVEVAAIDIAALEAAALADATTTPTREVDVGSPSPAPSPAPSPPPKKKRAPRKPSAKKAAAFEGPPLPPSPKSPKKKRASRARKPTVGSA